MTLFAWPHDVNLSAEASPEHVLAGGVILFSSARSYSLPQFNIAQLNGTVLAFTFAISMATGVIFGVFPALQLSRPDLQKELKGGAIPSSTRKLYPGLTCSYDSRHPAHPARRWSGGKPCRLKLPT